MIFAVDLGGDRTLRAASVLVRGTYSGMLEGYPIPFINDQILERIPGEAARALGDWPVHLIDPPVVVTHRAQPGPFGPEVRMPAYWIAAALDSASIDRAMHASSAIVVWFQDEPFPLPAEAALSALRDVPWEAFARDFEY